MESGSTAASLLPGRLQVVHDCDTDSIATDTTAVESEYEVEEVLDEGHNKHTNIQNWLVKWKDYPLGMCTWEPRENLNCDEVLQEWEIQKTRIAEGKAEPFDYTLFLEAHEEYQKEVQAKKQRRIRKREKRAKAAIQASRGRKRLQRKVDDRSDSFCDSTSESDDLPVRKRLRRSRSGSTSTRYSLQSARPARRTLQDPRRKSLPRESRQSLNDIGFDEDDVQESVEHDLSIFTATRDADSPHNRTHFTNAVSQNPKQVAEAGQVPIVISSSSSCSGSEYSEELLDLFRDKSTTSGSGPDPVVDKNDTRNEGKQDKLGSSEGDAAMEISPLGFTSIAVEKPSRLCPFIVDEGDETEDGEIRDNLQKTNSGKVLNNNKAALAREDDSLFIPQVEAPPKAQIPRIQASEHSSQTRPQIQPLPAKPAVMAAPPMVAPPAAMLPSKPSERPSVERIVAPPSQLDSESNPTSASRDNEEEQRSTNTVMLVAPPVSETNLPSHGTQTPQQSLPVIETSKSASSSVIMASSSMDLTPRAFKDTSKESGKRVTSEPQPPVALTMPKTSNLTSLKRLASAKSPSKALQGSKRSSGQDVFLPKVRTSSASSSSMTQKNKGSGSVSEKVSKPGFYNNLQHQYRARKKSAMEIPPDINALSLIDPKTGRIEVVETEIGKTAIASSNEKAPALSVTDTTANGPASSEDAEVALPLRGSQSKSAGNVDSTNDSDNLPRGHSVSSSPHQRTDILSQERREPSPTGVRALRRTESSQSITPGLSKIIPTGPSALAKANQGTRAPNRFSKYPRSQRQTATCWWWMSKSGCRYTDEQCYFAHRYLHADDKPRANDSGDWEHDDNQKTLHGDNTGIAAQCSPRSPESVDLNFSLKAGQDAAGNANIVPLGSKRQESVSGQEVSMADVIGDISPKSSVATAALANMHAKPVEPSTQVQPKGLAAQLVGKSPDHITKEKPDHIIQEKPDHITQEKPDHITQEKPDHITQEKPDHITQERSNHVDRLIPEYSTNVTLRVNSASMQVHLVIAEEQEFKELTGDLAPQVNIRATVMSNDFENILSTMSGRHKTKTSGGGISFHNVDAAHRDSLVDACNAQLLGFIATITGRTRQSHMLIYPASNDNWKFLDSYWPSITLNHEFPLRFRLFQQLPGFGATPFPNSVGFISPNPLSNRESTQLILESLLDLDDTLLHEPKGVIKIVFLMIPPSLELHYCTSFFLDFLGLKVYSAATPGAWDYVYRSHSKNNVLVMIHPSVSLWRVPYLSKVLTGSNFHFLQIGVDQNTALLQGTSLNKFSCTRLFYPHNTVTLITDDVFTHYPEKATSLIRRYMADNKLQNTPNKIAARPGIKKWLEELAARKTSEHQLTKDQPARHFDSRWIALYHAICELCPANQEDSFFAPLSDAPLVSLSSSGELAHYPALWNSDPVAATDVLVQWFATWSVYQASRFRRFCVCHQAAFNNPLREWDTVTDVHGRVRPRPEKGSPAASWSAQYAHLAVVSPDKLLTGEGR